MEKIKANIGPIIAALVIAYVLFGAQLKDKLTNLNLNLGGDGASSAETFPDKPTDGAIAGAAQKVVEILKPVSAEDKLKLARLWREEAKIIVMDNSVLKTTADIRRGNGAAGRLLDTTMKTKYPDTIGKGLSAVMTELLGNDAKALDPALRSQCAALFNGFSWAARQ